jgi:hypothetical protein
VPNEADVAAFKNYTPSSDAVDAKPAAAPQPAAAPPPPSAAPSVSAASYPPYTAGVFHVWCGMFNLNI